MIESIRDLFNDEILDKITSHFQLASDTLRPHEGFCSFVFQAQRGRERVILKISHSGRLSLDALRDELSFIDLAANLGASVCSPLTRSEDVFEVEDGRGERFWAYLYAHVAGESVEDRELHEDLLVALGEALGSFHAASRQIEHTRFENRRSFLEQELVQYHDILPADEDDTRHRFDAIVNAIRSLSWTRGHVGMIHGDAHEGNVLFDGSRAVLIDFDEIEVGFYVSDVAVLIESLCEREGARTREFVARTFEQFLVGYARHIDPNTLDWSSMGLFMKFSWISDHCLKHMLYGASPSDEYSRRRDLRRALFQSDFAEDRFLHEFDFQGVVDRRAMILS